MKLINDIYESTETYFTMIKESDLEKVKLET